jgi:hypothetical protein
VPREAANIYLYDGPPKTKPAGTTKMIAFTCPNRDWLTSQDNNTFHVRVYMPNWDFAEMMKARDLLAIDLLDVPKNYSESTKLGDWVANQRSTYRLHEEGKKSYLGKEIFFFW